MGRLLRLVRGQSGLDLAWSEKMKNTLCSWLDVLVVRRKFTLAQVRPVLTVQRPTYTVNMVHARLYTVELALENKPIEISRVLCCCRSG